MSYVYGPVPSWRLGQSLGVDPVPLKTCNWNCVYCQLGRSRPVVNRREDYVPQQDVVAEVRQALSAHDRTEIDWVTIVGSGEPLLHAHIGWMIREIKSITDIPVAVITNGALLYGSEIREELSAADAVLPSLDAGGAALYRHLNRPHPEVTFERHIEGLAAFRHEFKGFLWTEVMLVAGLNDSADEIGRIASLLTRIEPDEIHVNVPSRSPAESWVVAPSEDAVRMALTAFQHVAPARSAHAAEGAFDLSGSGNIADAVVNIITRHPMSEPELERTLWKWVPGHVHQVLAELEASGRAHVIVRGGKRFWSAAAAHFPEDK